MLSSIKIKNFKCFTENEFLFNRLTFLTGGNASGKSSLIQVLLLLSQIEKKGDLYSVLPIINDINMGLPEKLLSATSDDKDIKITIVQEDESYGFKLSVSNDLKDMYHFIIEGEKIEDFQKVYNISYINAERLSPKTFHKAGMKEQYVGINGEFTVEAISFYEKLGNITGGYSFPGLIEGNIGFKAACQKCLNRIFGNTELSIFDLEDEAGEKLLIKNDSNFYIPTATGFGISYCLPIIVQGLIATISKEQILIIENPEAHLHPKSQSELGKFLATIAVMGVQVIVETHSEHIINGARLILGNERDYNIFSTIYFTRERGAFLQKHLKIDEIGEMEEWPEGFFDQSEIDLRALLMRKIHAKP